MTKSQRLQPLVKVAESNEQKAAKVMAEAVALLNQHRNRLESLRQYRDDYVRRFAEAGAAGMPASQLIDYRAFISRLDNAIRDQEKIIDQHVQVVEDKKRVWLLTRSRTQSIDKAVDRFRRQEQRASDKREQRELDDGATRNSDKKNTL